MHFLEKSLVEVTRGCNSLRIFKQIQTQLTSHALLHDKSIINKLITFLSKSTDFASYSCTLLHNIRHALTSFEYNKILSNYAVSNKPRTTILTYRTFVRNGFTPDAYTFPPILKACGKFSGIKEGKQIHGFVKKLGFLEDTYVANTVLHFYGVCGDSINASNVFDEMTKRDVVSWTGVISAYKRRELYEEALSMFLKMDVERNLDSFAYALVFSGRVGCLRLGRGIHGLVLKNGFEIGNSLIDMYMKCEELFDAKRVFSELDKKDKVTWNSMISGLVQCKKSNEAIGLFNLMIEERSVKPDGFILTSVLSACASLGDVEYGKWVHEYVVSSGIEWDMYIGTAVVDMYAKCGYIEKALEVFDGIGNKNVYTWNALLTGLAIHGHGNESIGYFEEMVKLGFIPNEVTFLAVLNGCCHAGLVDEGRRYFNKMREYKVSPKLEHYGCLVDLLCRGGLLDEAMEVVKTMPFKPDVLICGALLSGFKNKGALVEIPREILDVFLDLEYEDCGVYVLLSNIFAANGRWDDVDKIRKLMKVKGILKVPGSSGVDAIKQ